MNANFTPNLFRACASALAVSIACGSASARIDEKRNSMETRLLSKSSGAYAYTSKEDKLREALELPYNKLFYIVPNIVLHNFYFKRADSKLTTHSDTLQQHDLFGWELHTCFDGDTSVLEFYRRHGDDMTPQELEALMELQKSQSSWRRSPYVEIDRDIDYLFDKGEMKLMLRDKDGNLVEADKIETLKEILPINRKRLVYLEIPENVLKSTNFSKTVRSQMLEVEQRSVNEAYRKLVEDKAKYSAAKTSRNKGKNDNAPNPQRVNRFDPTTHVMWENIVTDIENSLKGGSKASIYKFLVDDVYFGGNKVETLERSKEVSIDFEIPQQPDTAFGYTHELADGSIRAKLYKNGVLFVSAKFDKMMREQLEKLYEEQERQRKEEAADSISRF